MKFQLTTLAALLPFVAGSLDSFLDGLIHGSQLDFTVTYPDGSKLSTKDKPIREATKQTVLRKPVALGLDPPKVKMESLDNAAKKKHYVALFATWSLPLSEGAIDDAIISVPWYGINLTVGSDGTLDFLGAGADTGGRIDVQDDFAEVKNGTIQVWEQTEDLAAFLQGDTGTPWPTWFQLARVWSGTTSKVDYEFAIGEIQTKWQATDGHKRCDVDEMGAPIEGVEVGDLKSCEKTAGPWTDGDADEDVDQDDAKSGSEGAEQADSQSDDKQDSENDKHSGADDADNEIDSQGDDAENDEGAAAPLSGSLYMASALAFSAAAIFA